MRARIRPNTLIAPEDVKKHRTPKHPKHGVIAYIRIGSEVRVIGPLTGYKDGKEETISW